MQVARVEQQFNLPDLVRQLSLKILNVEFFYVKF